MLQVAVGHRHHDIEGGHVHGQVSIDEAFEGESATGFDTFDLIFVLIGNKIEQGTEIVGCGGEIESVRHRITAPSGDGTSGIEGQATDGKRPFAQFEKLVGHVEHRRLRHGNGERVDERGAVHGEGEPGDGQVDVRFDDVAEADGGREIQAGQLRAHHRLAVVVRDLALGNVDGVEPDGGRAGVGGGGVRLGRHQKINVRGSVFTHDVAQFRCVEMQTGDIHLPRKQRTHRHHHAQRGQAHHRLAFGRIQQKPFNHQAELRKRAEERVAELVDLHPIPQGFFEWRHHQGGESGVGQIQTKPGGDEHHEKDKSGEDADDPFHDGANLII